MKAMSLRISMQRCRPAPHRAAQPAGDAVGAIGDFGMAARRPADDAEEKWGCFGHFLFSLLENTNGARHHRACR
jgi:hypothetical protein